MANYVSGGQVASSTAGPGGIKLYWVETSRDEAKQDSVIEISFEYFAETSGPLYLNRLKVYVNGEQVYYNPKREGIERHIYQHVKFNANGSKTLQVGFHCYLSQTDTDTTAWEKTASGYFNLHPYNKPGYITSAPTSFTDAASYINVAYKNPNQYRVKSLQLGMFIERSGNETNTICDYREVDRRGGTYQLNIPQSGKNNIWAKHPNDRSSTAYIYLKTILEDGTTKYNSSAANIEIINSKPNLSVVYEDVDANITNLTKDNKIILQGESNIKYTMTYSANKSANIKSISASCGGTSTDKASSTWYNIQSNKMYFSAIDSRDLETKVNLQPKMVPYFRPVVRMDIDTTLTAEQKAKSVITISGSAYRGKFNPDKTGSPENSITLQFAWKVGSKYGAFETLTPTWSGNDFSITVIKENLDYTQSYEAKVRLSDTLYGGVYPNSYREVVKLASQLPIFDWSSYNFNFNVPIYYKDKPLAITTHEKIDGWDVIKYDSGLKIAYYKEAKTCDLSHPYGSIFYENHSLSIPATIFSSNIIYANLQPLAPMGVIQATPKYATTTKIDYHLSSPNKDAYTFDLMIELVGF